jgi:plasmid segregation protein ParM
LNKITQNLLKLDKVSIHGLDIGNATCKNNNGIIFDSKITTVEPMTKTNKMIIDNKTYYLGEGAFDTTYRKIDKVNYINFVYGLLALSTNTVHNCVALGLPLGQFKEDRNALINLIMSNNNKIVRMNEFIEKPLIIDDVEIFPEGVSTLKDDEEFIIIDIGGLTTDTALVINERGKRKIINPISIPTGTINLYTDFINNINSKYSLNLKIDDAERILKKGLTLDGNKVNVDFALEMYQEYSNSLISQLQLNYNIRTNPISLTGGGATILHTQLKNRLGNSLILQDDSIFANARNFYELGLSVFGEE